MIAIEPLKTSNDDDFNDEWGESFKKRADANKLKFKDNQLESSTGTSAIINQGEKQHLPDDTTLRIPKVTYENTTQMRIYLQMLRYLALSITLSYPMSLLFVGIHYSYDYDPKKLVTFWFAMMLFPFVYGSIIYTQCLHYINGDYIRILELCAVYGIGISCGQKYFGFLKHRYNLFSLMFVPGKLCRINVVGRRADIIKCGLRKMLTLIKTFGIGALACMTFLLAVPAKSLIVDNEWMLIFPMKIVFFDESTLSGFVGATISQAVMGLMAGSGVLLYGASFIVVVSNYLFKVDLIREDFKDLDEMWSRTSAVSVAYKHAYLKNICIKRQDMNKYLDFVKQIYETKLMTYFFYNYFSQIVCLFEIIQMHWTPGYALAAGLFIEMLFYCIMGTLISMANEKLCDYICDTKWYTYDLPSQRIVMLLLHDCQNAGDIQLGPIGPLNVVTFIQIIVARQLSACSDGVKVLPDTFNPSESAES